MSKLVLLRALIMALAVASAYTVLDSWPSVLHAQESDPPAVPPAIEEETEESPLDGSVGMESTFQPPSAPPCQMPIPWPFKFGFSAPAPDVAPSLTTYLGVWEGTSNIGTGRALISRQLGLAVTKIDNDRASIVFVRGEASAPNQPAPRAFATTAEVRSDGQLRWVTGSTITLGPIDGGQILTGVNVQTNGNVSSVNFQRCTLP